MLNLKEHQLFSNQKVQVLNLYSIFKFEFEARLFIIYLVI